MDGKTRGESMREGREKFKSLSFKGKIGYIWDYYKAAIGAVLAVILVVCVCAHAIKGSGKETVLSAAFINAEKVDGGEVRELQDAFGSFCGLDEGKESLSFDDTYLIDLENGDQITVACQTKLMASMQAETLDIVLMPEDIYENYVGSGAFMKLEEALGEELLDKTQGLLRMDRAENDREDWAYALKLTGNEKLKDIYGDRDVYLAVAVSAGHMEKIEEFVKYLLS